MRIVLFDGILESHLHESLERSLRRRGHEVLATGKIGHGFRFPHPISERLNLERAVADTIAFEPDWAFVFRPASLPPHLLERLRARGIRTVAWFSDDPVLFDLSYGPVVDQYDRILHCGNEAVLQHYESFFGRPTGVNFPFWTDHEAFPHVWGAEQPESRAMFLGNVQDAVRRRRYFDLAKLGDDIRIHGKIGSDYWHRSAGYLDGDDEVVAAGGRTSWAINIPQFFKDHRGLETWFPGLDELGFFEFPSRVVQYMAMGIPTISIVPSSPRFETYPEMVVVDDVDAAIEVVRGDDWDDARLAQHSALVGERFRRHFSADARVLALESFLTDDSWTELDAAGRASWFTRFDATAVEALPAQAQAPSVAADQAAPTRLPARAVVVAEAQRHPASLASALIDSFEALGIDLQVVDAPDDAAALAEALAEARIDDALVMVCSERLQVGEDAAATLAARGARTALVVDAPLEVNRASAALASNFDALVLADPATHRRFRDAGFDHALHVSAMISPRFAEAVAARAGERGASIRVAADARVEEAMSSGLAADLAAAALELRSWRELEAVPLEDLAAIATVEVAFLSPGGTRSAPRFDNLLHHLWFAADQVVLPRLVDLVNHPALAETSILAGDAGELGRKSWRYLDSPAWRAALERASAARRPAMLGTAVLSDLLVRLAQLPSPDRLALASASGLLDHGSSVTVSMQELGSSGHGALVTVRSQQRYGDVPQMEVRVLLDGATAWSAPAGDELTVALGWRASVEPQRIRLQVRYAGRARNIGVAGSHRIQVTSVPATVDAQAEGGSSLLSVARVLSPAG